VIESKQVSFRGHSSIGSSKFFGGKHWRERRKKEKQTDYDSYHSPYNGAAVLCVPIFFWWQKKILAATLKQVLAASLLCGRRKCECVCQRRESEGGRKRVREREKRECVCVCARARERGAWCACVCL